MAGAGLARDTRSGWAGLRRRLRALPCAALLCALPAGHATAAPTADSPYAEGAHQALAQRVTGAQSAAYRQVLAELDAWLKRRPDDSAAAVERCRFMEEFAGGEDGGGVEGAEQEAGQCREALAQGALAGAAAVKLFLLERDYGKDAAAHAEALLPQSVSWTGPQRARLYGLLAARWQRQDPLKAGRYALLAVEFDPASGQRLSAADYLSRIGAHQRALALIEGMPPQQWQVWTLRSAIASLIAMNEAPAALRLSQARPDLKLDAASRIKLAHALLDAGDDAAARALMKALLEEPAPKNSYGYAQELELFEFQRDHGERADAIAAYRRLRDKGAAADPYGRYRLSLSWRYPDAPWRAEDWRGVGTLLLYLGLFTLLPAFLVVPLHYRGAVLQARGLALPPPLPAWPWGLGQLWYVLAVVLAGGGLGLYIFCYPQFQALLRAAPPLAGPPADSRSLAHLALFANALNLAALLPLLRRVSPAQLLKGRWPVGQSLAAGLGMAILVLAAGAVLARLEGAVKPGIALGSDTIRALQGIYTLYGAGALLLSAALVTPLTEELMFRGVYLRVAARYLPFWLAAAIQALVFIGLHDQPGAYPVLFLLALGGAWLARRSGGLLAPITLHLVNNSVAALAIMGLTRSLSAMP
jgi:membrane protease YdiL (CAAX protease family)